MSEPRKKDYRLGWHVLGENGLRYGDSRHPEVGVPLEMRRVPGEPEQPTLCEIGMHASPTIREALRYRPLDSDAGRELTLVLVFGELTARHRGGIYAHRGERKFVGRRRVVLARWSAERVGRVLTEEARRLKIRLERADPRRVYRHPLGWRTPIPDRVWLAVERRLLRSAGLEV